MGLSDLGLWPHLSVLHYCKGCTISDGLWFNFHIKLPEFFGAFGPFLIFVYRSYTISTSVYITLFLNIETCIFVFDLYIHSLKAPWTVYQCINIVYNIYTTHSLVFWTNFQQHVGARKKIWIYREGEDSMEIMWKKEFKRLEES